MQKRLKHNSIIYIYLFLLPKHRASLRFSPVLVVTGSMLGADVWAPGRLLSPHQAGALCSCFTPSPWRRRAAGRWTLVWVSACSRGKRCCKRSNKRAAKWFNCLNHICGFIRSTRLMWQITFIFEQRLLINPSLALYTSGQPVLPQWRFTLTSRIFGASFFRTLPEHPIALSDVLILDYVLLSLSLAFIVLPPNTV